jgi:hypothetical protein
MMIRFLTYFISIDRLYLMGTRTSKSVSQKGGHGITANDGGTDSLIIAKDGETSSWVIILGLCLVCTFGTPVANMLAHSPPFSLAIDYDDQCCNIAAEDDEQIILALKQRDRVRRIRIRIRIHLRIPVPNLQKVVMAINEGISSFGIPAYGASG